MLSSIYKVVARCSEEKPNVIVEIAGEDTISYGGKTPSQGSWKKWAIDYLEKII